jgi:hypothetical protein
VDKPWHTSTPALDFQFTFPLTGAADCTEAGDFECRDLDESVSKNQRLCVKFDDCSRIVVRLPGTGSSGATIRARCDLSRSACWCFWCSDWLITMFLFSRMQEEIADYIPSLDQGLAVQTAWLSYSNPGLFYVERVGRAQADGSEIGYGVLIYFFHRSPSFSFSFIHYYFGVFYMICIIRSFPNYY